MYIKFSILPSSLQRIISHKESEIDVYRISSPSDHYSDNHGDKDKENSNERKSQEFCMISNSIYRNKYKIVCCYLLYWKRPLSIHIYTYIKFSVPPSPLQRIILWISFLAVFFFVFFFLLRWGQGVIEFSSGNTVTWIVNNGRFLCRKWIMV